MKTIENVIKILSEKLGIDESEINGESNLLDDLGMDSLDMVEVIMAMEKEFEINMSDEELVGIKTVNDLVKKIEEKVAQ